MAAELPRYFGRYVLLKLLGAGAMGDVHLARPYNKSSGIPTPIVVKRLHADLSEQDEFVKRFLHEAEFAVAVNSDAVARVYDLGRADDFLYITAEYIAGWGMTDLASRVKQAGAWASVPAVIDLVVGGLHGLQAIHEAKDAKGNHLGLVHRDISGRNLMVDEDGKLRVIDFGLSKSKFKDWKTRTGATLGSLGYMPPEQARGEQVDQRADVYAMTAAMYELLCLDRIVKNASIQMMMLESANPTIRPPSTYRRDIPPALDQVMMRALSKNRDERYATAAELAAALDRIMPPAQRIGASQQLVQAAFGAEIPARRAEVQALLALPDPDTEDGPPVVKTTSFMRRHGIKPITEEDLPPMSTRVRPGEAPTVARAPSSAEAPMPSLSGATHRKEARSEPASVGPPQAVTAPMSASPQMYKRPRLPNRVVIGLMGLMVVAGIALDRAVLRPESQTAIIQPQPVPEQPAPGVASAAVPAAEPPLAAPEVPDAGVAEAAPAQVAAPARPRPASKAAPVAPAPPPAAPAPPPPEPSVLASKDAVNAKLQSLLNRATVLRKKVADGKPEADQIDTLINDLSLEMASPDAQSSAKRIPSLESSLGRLERGAP